MTDNVQENEQQTENVENNESTTKHHSEIRTILELTFGKLYNSKYYKLATETDERENNESDQVEQTDIQNKTDEHDDLDDSQLKPEFVLTSEALKQIDMLTKHREEHEQRGKNEILRLQQTIDDALKADKLESDKLRKSGLVSEIDVPLWKTHMSMDIENFDTQNLIKVDDILRLDEERIRSLSTDTSASVPPCATKHHESSENKETKTAQKKVGLLTWTNAEIRENKQLLQSMKIKQEYLKPQKHYVQSQCHINLSNPSIGVATGVVLNDKEQYMREYRVKKTQVHNTSKTKLDHSQSTSSSGYFLVVPSEVKFENHCAGELYTKELNFINVTSESRSLVILPPSTQYFSILDISYPSPHNMIAPGLHAKVIVEFAPDTLQDFDDSVVVVTETGKFTVNLLARRILPELLMPHSIQFKPCLVHDKIFQLIKCKNVGGEGKFRITNTDMQFTDVQQDFADPHNFVYSGCFNESDVDDSFVFCTKQFKLFPHCFALDPNQEISLYVAYTPNKKGNHTQSFRVICDNGQIKDYSLQASCHNIDLALTKIHDNTIYDHQLKVSQNASSCSHIPNVIVHFDATNVNSSSKGSIVINNASHVVMEYQFKKIEGCDYFSFTNPNGSLELGENQFEIEFLPKMCDKNRIVESVWSLLLTKIPVITNVTDSPRITKTNINILTLKLQSRILASTIWCKPKILVFDQPVMLLNTCYTTHFSLSNQSKSISQYEFDGDIYIQQSTTKLLSSKLCISDAVSKVPVMTYEHEDCQISISPAKGKLNHAETVLCKLDFFPKRIGQFQITIPYTIKFNQTKQMLQLSAYVVGPTVIATSKHIDFGILNFGQKNISSTQKIVLKNESNQDAHVTFAELCHSDPLLSPQLSFEHEEITVPAKGKISMDVSLTPSKCQSYRSHIQCNITNGTPNVVIIAARAEVQAPRVILSSYLAQLNVSFVKVRRIFKVTITNCTELETFFEWSNHHEPTHIAEFEPSAGQLRANASVQCTLCFVGQTPCNLSLYFACKMIGIDKPLILELKTVVKDLKISYHIPKGDSSHKRKLKRIQLQLDKQVRNSENEEIPHIKDILGEKEVKWMNKYYPPFSELPTLNFGKKEPIYSQSFCTLVLRNHTSITANFTLSFDSEKTNKRSPKFFKEMKQLIADLKRQGSLTAAALDYSSKKFISSDAQTILTSADGSVVSGDPDALLDSATSIGGGSDNKSVSFSTQSEKSKMSSSNKSFGFGKSNSTKPSARSYNTSSMHSFASNSRRILSIPKDETRFSSQQGQTFMKDKLQKQQIRKILNGQGAAFVVVPETGIIEPWSTVEIQCYCFNDMCGSFEDRLQCEIEGINPVWINCKIGVIGSPLSFGTNCVGLSFPEYKIPATENDSELIDRWPVLKWMPKVLNSGCHRKIITVCNDGSFDIKLRFHVLDFYESEANLVSTDVALDYANNLDCKINLVQFSSMRKNDFKNYPFTIEPCDIIVNGRSKTKLTVSFDSNEKMNSNKVAPWLYGEVFVKKENFAKIQGRGDVILEEDEECDYDQDDDSADDITNNDISIPITTTTYKKTHKKDANKNETWIRAPDTLQNNSLYLRFEAKAVTPKFFVDKAPWVTSTSQNDQELKGIMFRYHAPLSTSSTKTQIIDNLTLWNQTGAQLSCSISISPSNILDVVNYSTSNVSRFYSHSSREKICTVKNNHNVNVVVEFHPPSTKNILQWPLTAIHEMNGGLQITFSNKSNQIVPVKCFLYRPILKANYTAIVFNDVFPNHIQTKKVDLANVSFVQASWKISYVQPLKYSSHNVLSSSTLKKLSSQELDPFGTWIDDPTCFNCDPCTGTIRGKSLSKSEGPPGSNIISADTGVLNQSALAYDFDRQPVTIEINFEPKKVGNYKSNFVLTVENGNDIEFTMFGICKFQEPSRTRGFLDRYN